MQRSPRLARRLTLLVLTFALVLSSCNIAGQGLYVVGPGLRAIPLLSPEGLAVVANYLWGPADETAQFGPLEGAIIVAIATETGITFVDLLTGEVLYAVGSTAAAPLFGLVGMRDGSGYGSYAGVVGYGTGGATWLKYDGSGSTFDSPMDFGSSVTYDMYQAGGDMLADLVTKVQPSLGVRFLTNQPAPPPVKAPGAASAGPQSVWTISTEVLPAGNFSGELVSAFVADDDLVNPAPALVLTRGVSSYLYLDDRDGDAPVIALTLGLDARKLRCVDTESSAGWLCAVSLFGDDQLALLNWDGAGLPVMRGTVDVGDGPVGIDLVLLDDGDVAIVSTGFNDDSVTEVKVSNVGTLVSTRTREAPAGCVSPGHAVYFEDDGGLALVGTCWQSGNYFVLRTAL
ncbi:MAG TPA: hypothetical protein VF202_14990 [Trueperaceae bacterium]|jgi:hypothetical protein